MRVLLRLSGFLLCRFCHDSGTGFGDVVNKNALCTVFHIQLSYCEVVKFLSGLGQQIFLFIQMGSYAASVIISVFT